jgi:hypothetical protein
VFRIPDYRVRRENRQKDADWTETSPEDRREDACTCLIIAWLEEALQKCRVLFCTVGLSVVLHCLFRNRLVAKSAAVSKLKQWHQYSKTDHETLPAPSSVPGCMRGTIDGLT